jgi:hypothetical protein
MTAADCRDRLGLATVEPLALGNRPASACALLCTVSSGAPTASRSGRAVPSAWSSSASRTWTGSTAGLPALPAARTAAASASWLRVVSL